MTRHRGSVLILLTFVLGSTSSTSLPLTPIPPSPAVQATFRGLIPTESNPIRGEARLAKMRQEGRLPDTFRRDGCRYDLAGDPAVAYYVETCGPR